MSSRMIRGHWLSSGAKFVKAHYPSDTGERLIGVLQKSLRLSLADVDPVQWYPRSVHVELLRAIAATRKDEATAYEDMLAYGRFVASEMASGSLELFTRIATTKLFAKKLPGLWQREHQEDGRLESDIAALDEARLPLRLVGANDYDHVGVMTLGWVGGTLAALGHKNLSIKQNGWTLKQPAPADMTAEVRWS